MKDLTKGNINRQILTFAIPIFISYLFTQAYNLVDIRIIGSFLGNDALAAVGSVSTFNDMLNGFIIGLSNGFAILTARFFGEKSDEGVRHSLGNALTLGFLITLCCMLLSIWQLPGILRVLHVQKEHFNSAYSYIFTIICGLLFCCIYNVLVACLRAIGDSFTPLCFLIFSTVLNGFLDYYFVGSLSLGVSGAAKATILSQCIAMILCFIYTWMRYQVLRIRMSDLIPRKYIVEEMLPSGFSMGFMSCLVNIGTVTLQTAINGLGTNIIVAHAATRKLSYLLMMPFNTLATTMATFVSQNYGAGEYRRIKLGIRNVLLMSYIWAVAACVLVYTLYPYFIVGITDTKIPEVIETAWLYQKVDSLFFCVVSTIIITRNCLQGMGDHVTPIVSSLLEMFGKILITLIFTPVFGYWAVIWTEPVVWFIMIVPLIISLVKKAKSMSDTKFA